MTQIHLSICMPTYSFGRFIGDALESILRQAADDVEIVVLDGASTDNTSEVVRSFQARFPKPHYHRRDRRGGIRPDPAPAGARAHGQTRWLLSSAHHLRGGAPRGA